MNRNLFNEITSLEALTTEEIASIYKERTGKDLDELGDEWFSMVEFEFNIEQYDEHVAVNELGAGTAIVIVKLRKRDVEQPFLSDQNLLDSMAVQMDYIGEIARFIKCDESLRFDSAGEAQYDEDIIELSVAA